LRLECNIPKAVPVVYEIVNVRSGKRYVGSTTRYRYRFREHRRQLRMGEHSSRHFQNAYNKYGEDCFVMRPLEIVTQSDCLIKREQAWIDFFDWRRLYNSSKTAGKAKSHGKTVYSICPATECVKRFRDANHAAASVWGDVEKSGLINKAARKLATSGGFYWSYEACSLADVLSQKNAAAKNRDENALAKVFALNRSGIIVAEFSSIAHAVRVTGLPSSQISSAINSGKYRTCGGLIWSRKRNPKIADSKKTKAVFQVFEDGTTKLWSSCKKAANELRHLGVNHKGISSAATGYTKSHKGFRWVFAKT